MNVLCLEAMGQICACFWVSVQYAVLVPRREEGALMFMEFLLPELLM